MPHKEAKGKKNTQAESSKAFLRPVSHGSGIPFSPRAEVNSSSRKRAGSRRTPGSPITSVKRRAKTPKARLNDTSFEPQTPATSSTPNESDKLGKGTENALTSLGASQENALHSRALQIVADRLANSLVALRSNLADAEQRIAALEQTNQTAGRGRIDSAHGENSSSQMNRLEQDKAQLQAQIAKTNEGIRKLLTLSSRLEKIQHTKAKSLAGAKKKIEMEIKELEREKEMNVSIIREGFGNRVRLLRRYWPWRQLLELGDTMVAPTFEEELKRGPRHRHVGIQNNVRSDYLEQQIKWLEAIKSHESAFQNRLWQLERFVEDLYDINDMIQAALSCTVCGMLYDNPVLFWPCGHSFCYECFQSLSIAPSLYRCSICGSINSEGFLHNLLLTDTVAKWMFKDLGFSNLQEPLSSIRIHHARFQKNHSDDKLVMLKHFLKKQTRQENEKGSCDNHSITISYRTY